MKLKTVKIQGKDYAPVSERIKYFREHFPTHSLRTEIILADETQALIKAVIRGEDDRILAEGIAFEKAGSSYINKGSHIENAETSAWGRALGNFGIGIDASVASADELAKAVAGQAKGAGQQGTSPQPAKQAKNPSSQASQKQIEYITNLATEKGLQVAQLYAEAGVKDKPTKEQASKIIERLQKPGKQKPSAIQVMEYINDCKSVERVEAVHAQAMKYEWSDEDKKKIDDCRTNRKNAIEEEMVQAERAGMKAA